MTSIPRVLDPEPVGDLAAYVEQGGGAGLAEARRIGPAAVIDVIEASGLRGRGGAGFPTGTKWRTVARFESPAVPTTVVVNGAEGEPGTFKDRAILRGNPYRVLEGALVAAVAVGADRVVVALKRSFAAEAGRVRAAIEEVTAAGWAEGVAVEVVLGPDEYLYGEETGLLEVLAGRAPFPRVAPPFRHGVDEVGEGGESAAGVQMASPGGETVAPPALVNNVETLANVAGIVANGAEWFRSVGTPDSPGTVVCTVTGRTRRHGVGEFALGTPLSEVLDSIGGGPAPGSRYVAVLSGVANPLVPASLLDTPVSYEAMEAIGSGLGAAGFIVFDDTSDLVAVAHGVARFLSVESCGQCTPCKQDGLALAGLLDGLRRSEATENDVEQIRGRIATVADEARCFLASQQERVLASVLELFPDAVAAHLAGAEPAEIEPIAALLDIEDGRAVVDEAHLNKQPDWSFDEPWSGKSPADEVDQRFASSR